MLRGKGEKDDYSIISSCVTLFSRDCQNLGSATKGNCRVFFSQKKFENRRVPASQGTFSRC